MNEIRGAIVLLLLVCLVGCKEDLVYCKHNIMEGDVYALSEGNSTYEYHIINTQLNSPLVEYYNIKTGKTSFARPEDFNNFIKDDGKSTQHLKDKDTRDIDFARFLADKVWEQEECPCDDAYFRYDVFLCRLYEIFNSDEYDYAYFDGTREIVRYKTVLPIQCPLENDLGLFRLNEFSRTLAIFNNEEARLFLDGERINKEMLCYFYEKVHKSNQRKLEKWQ